MVLSRDNPGPPRPWLTKRPAIVVMIGGALTALAVTLGALVDAIDFWSKIWPPNPNPVLYRLYVSTDDKDEDFGPPTIIRRQDESEKLSRIGYRPAEILGYGYPIDIEDPGGTHLVYDSFCKVSKGDPQERCGGSYRSHYYSTNEKPFMFAGRTEANKIEIAARIFDTQSDGTCDSGQRLLGQWTKISPSGATLYKPSAGDPGDGWTMTEVLGCVNKEHD